MCIWLFIVYLHTNINTVGNTNTYFTMDISYISSFAIWWCFSFDIFSIIFERQNQCKLFALLITKLKF